MVKTSLVILAATLTLVAGAFGPDRTDTVSGSSGTINSLNYPGNYLPLTKHRWIINAPQGSFINLHFRNPFNLENAFLSSSCYDSVSIYDGISPPARRCTKNARTTARFCGRRAPNDWITSSNTVVVEFCSDYSNQLKGFSIQWASILPTTTVVPPTGGPPGACGQASPSFPQNINITNGQVQPTIRDNKIVGGTHAPAHSWPWAVALFTKSSWSDQKYQFCGGTLIAPNWVLTAAHCFYNHDPQDMSGYWAKFGADFKQASSGDSTVPNESTQQVCRIITYIEHPDYNHNTHSHDMTLLHLDCTVNYTASVKPVCLPSSSENRPVTNEEVVTIGWGTTSAGGDDSPFLRQVVLKAISNDQCNSEYDGAIDDTMFCCLTPAKDSCQGDSGGGVFSFNGGKWEVTGIVSWGRGCAEPGYGGVYGKVVTMVDWLKQTILPN